MSNIQTTYYSEMDAPFKQCAHFVKEISESTKPYVEVIRFNKPQGTMLVFWPYVWGLTLSAFHVSLSPWSYSAYLLKFFLCAFLVRSSACTINDILDRDIDRLVERTKGRPIAQGRLSVSSAGIFFVVQILFCIALFSTFNYCAFIVGLFVIPLITVYPMLKRVTSWPQAWLGVAANTGIPIAWAAVRNSVDYRVVVPLMISAWCWTMLYDTIYACQDKRDDVKAGVRSTALLFGAGTRAYLICISTSFVAMFAYVGVLNNQGIAYFVISVSGTAVHVTWQLLNVDLDDPASCGANFRHNSQLGYLIWSGMMIDYLSKAIRAT